MKPTNNKWKDYIWEDTLDCSFELGYTIGRLKRLTVNYWKKLNKTHALSGHQKFKQQLPELLASKLKEMPDVKIPAHIFTELSNEMYKLLACSLASNRTPDEIILGLQADTEMRNEVVALLTSGVNSKTSLDDQRFFLNKILAGDDDLRILLNKQKKKKGFPHNI